MRVFPTWPRGIDALTPLRSVLHPPKNVGELLRADITRRGRQMKSRVETLTPPNTPNPIGPYSHIAKVGEHIWIGGTAGVDPATGQLAANGHRRPDAANPEIVRRDA